MVHSQFDSRLMIYDCVLSHLVSSAFQGINQRPALPLLCQVDRDG